MMRKTLLLLSTLTLVAACSSERRPDIPVQSAMPPVGLASTAVWLEQRQGNAPRVPSERDIATSEIRSVVSGRSTAAATPVAQPAIPDRAEPSGTIALAAQAFTDTCVASLPDMTGVEQRFDQVSRRDFGVVPNEAGRNYFLSGQRRGDIFMSVALGAGRSNIFQCSISVRRQDQAQMAQTLVNTVTDAGYALTRVAATGDAQQEWTISGAPEGTRLKMVTRTNVLGQKLTGVWIVWR
ncbi:hypothetical protein GCM10007385_37400 [Tateyamaria omphalii]|uniref:hypothetical protein n=1 Tax=Tateyamaria omphalii TaxID=299262 RepID=UPI0016745CF7|nr:hypothetical protein [Tateyamaria omphalii]GGX64803.1 hypothetical protein GCM10007385_37400 [Tateyamaria omphalii]